MRAPASRMTGDGLTDRERDVVRMVRHGLTNRQIGESLWTTEGTAKAWVHNALVKLHFKNRAQLAVWYRENYE